MKYPKESGESYGKEQEKPSRVASVRRQAGCLFRSSCPTRFPLLYALSITTLVLLFATFFAVSFLFTIRIPINTIWDTSRPGLMTALLSFGFDSPRTASEFQHVDALAQELTMRHYVAFGDSFAAGMGTGNTDWDGCRHGEFSYPKIIAAAFGNLTFQNLACSGAATKDVASDGSKTQISTWKNASQADFGTVTVGGNDLRFYDVLTACVVRVGGIFAGDCAHEIARANESMHDGAFGTGLIKTMQSILNQSGRPDFKLFFVGYPGFFNSDQDDCEQVTFSIWNPHHSEQPQSDLSATWLHKDLRLALNTLVAEVNALISKSVEAVNRVRETSSAQNVTFIDPNPVYNSHRFCEKNTREPDSHRNQTYFFLNGWDDFIPDTIKEMLPNTQSLIEQDNGTGQDLIPLPDPKNCKKLLSETRNQDWTGM